MVRNQNLAGIPEFDAMAYVKDLTTGKLNLEIPYTFSLFR